MDDSCEICSDDETEFDDELDEVEIIQGDHGDHALCILEWLLLTPKQPINSHRHAFFRTYCAITKKVCDVIVDNSSTQNVVSHVLV